MGTETLRAVLVGMLREAWCARCLKKMRAHPDDAPIHPKPLLEDPEIFRRRTIEELNPPRLSDGELSYTDELAAVWRDRPELIQSTIDKIEAKKPIRASTTLIMDDLKGIIWEERKAREADVSADEAWPVRLGE